MRDQAPFWAAVSTVIVWMAVAGIVVALLMLTPLAMPWNVLAVVILAGIGMGGTITIWENIAKMRMAGLAQSEQAPDQQQARQRKLKRERQQRLGRLIEDLDEDEAIELESLLMSRAVDEVD